MALELIPNGDLVFKGPFTAVSITALKLANSGNDPLAYKIKTTAPKRYCVKPNSGFLDAHATAAVQVMLQPSTPGQDDDRSKHKFMVQWAILPPNYSDEVENFWKNDASKTIVKDYKLKCVFADEFGNTDETNHSSSRAEAPTDRVLFKNDSNLPQQASNKIDTATPFNSTQRSVVNRSRQNNPAQDHPQETGDGSNAATLKQELDYLKKENQNLSERLQLSNVTHRTVGSNRIDNPVIDRLKPNSKAGHKELVLFGISLNDRLVLLAFVIALLFGFSLGYFFFSCGN